MRSPNHYRCVAMLTDAFRGQYEIRERWPDKDDPDYVVLDVVQPDGSIFGGSCVTVLEMWQAPTGKWWFQVEPPVDMSAIYREVEYIKGLMGGVRREYRATGS